MSEASTRRSGKVLGASLVCAALALSACGSSSKSGSSATTTTAKPTADAKLIVLVPVKVKTAGKVIVATDASYAPNEFYASDNKTIQGMDIDLANAIAGELGVKADIQNASFDTIIPALGNRYDVGMSSFTDNKKRQEQVDFVDYFTAGTSFYVETGKNADLSSLAALCGKKVAVEKGTTQLDDATAQSKTCTDGGKAAVTVLAFPDQNGANLALSSGRADVVMADSPVAGYAVVQSAGKFALAGKPYGEAPYGIAVPKTAAYKGMTSAIQGALQKLQANGTYAKILKKWGVESGAVTSFPINGGTGAG